jgi:hypothetical protein
MTVVDFISKLTRRIRNVILKKGDVFTAGISEETAITIWIDHSIKS